MLEFLFWPYLIWHSVGLLYLDRHLSIFFYDVTEYFSICAMVFFSAHLLWRLGLFMVSQSSTVSIRIKEYLYWVWLNDPVPPLCFRELFSTVVPCVGEGFHSSFHLTDFSFPASFQFDVSSPITPLLNSISICWISLYISFGLLFLSSWSKRTKLYILFEFIYSLSCFNLIKIILLKSVSRRSST